MAWMRMNHKGMTMAEVVVAIGVTALALGSVFAAMAGTKAIAQFNRSQAQAIQVVRSRVELLRATAFGNIANSTTNNVSYDSGPDGIVGNADDRTGTLTVAVRDAADFDGDGNTNETSVDIDADNANDVSAAAPVRVTFTWAEWMLGTKRNFSVSIDTLISA
jgi:type II secretory pathway pseudopilin PulG